MNQPTELLTCYLCRTCQFRDEDEPCGDGHHDGESCRPLLLSDLFDNRERTA